MAVNPPGAERCPSARGPRSPRGGGGGSTAAALLLAASMAAGCGGEGSTGPVPGLPPTVLEVEPDVLQRGDTAVLHGLNFAPRAGGNRVRIGGAEARVLSPASETRLRVRVDDSGEAPCVPTRPVEVSVTVGGRSGTTTHPLAAVDPLRLSPGGDTSLVETGGVRCQNLPSEEAVYLVSLFNATTAAGFDVDFRIRGRTPDVTGTSAGGSVGAGGSPYPPTPRSGLLAEIAEGRRRETEILRRGGEALGRPEEPPVRRRAGGRARGAAPAAGEVPAEGDLLEFRVPDLTRSDACASYHRITGRVVHVSSTAVVVEDTEAPLAGEMDSTYRSLAREYEEVMDPIIRANFGDPLAYDDQLDGDGRFTMLFTPRVNDISGVLAFVWGGDFGARSGCASSDERELFYGLVPTRLGPDPTTLETVRGWERVMRSTTIHEVKHITAFAEHRAGGSARQEDSWLEEASAMVAEEIYAREIYGYSAGGNTGYEGGVSCEIRLDDAGCPDDALIMAAHFSFLREYLEAVENRSPLGGGIASLGGGWWLLRWALDHAPGSEAAFLRALTGETGLFGVENLEARAGESFPALLARWSLSLEADDRPDLAVPARAELSVPSWDVRSVFEGLHRDRTGSFPDPYPLSPRRRGYGDFLISVNGLPGGSTVLLELTAPGDRPQVLEILGDGRDAPLEDLGISVLRVR